MDKYRIVVKGIVQQADKYLVVSKWYDDRVSEPFSWEFIDGEIEFGENPDKAVLRIIQEQTGLSANIDRILYTWSFMTGDVFNIGISYLCIVAFDEVIISEELLDSRWVERIELENYIDQRILEDMEKAEY